MFQIHTLWLLGQFCNLALFVLQCCIQDSETYFLPTARFPFTSTLAISFNFSPAVKYLVHLESHILLTEDGKDTNNYPRLTKQQSNNKQEKSTLATTNMENQVLVAILGISAFQIYFVNVVFIVHNV